MSYARAVGRRAAAVVLMIAAAACSSSHSAASVPCQGTASVCRVVRSQVHVYEESGATSREAECLANITARRGVKGTETVLVTGDLQKRMDACGISARVWNRIGEWTRAHYPLPH